MTWPPVVPVDLLALSRATICIFAGEVAIRYAAWSYVVALSARRDILILPLLCGITSWAAMRFGIEARWVVAMGDPGAANRIASLVENDWMSELFRAGVVLSLGALIYPVTKIQYRHSWERAVVEMVVRLFLILTSGVVGYMLAMVHIFH